jgi:hypothetical protein
VLPEPGAPCARVARSRGAQLKGKAKQVMPRLPGAPTRPARPLGRSLNGNRSITVPGRAETARGGHSLTLRGRRTPGAAPAQGATSPLRVPYMLAALPLRGLRHEPSMNDVFPATYRHVFFVNKGI